MTVKKIKIGDSVIVLTGKDKKKKGTVLKRVRNTYLVVEGVNLKKKHTKGNPQKQKKGGIVEFEAPIHVSNVAIYNAQVKKGDRFGVKYVQGDKRRQRVRYFKSTNEVIDV
jgi:large subunit ribosomal protein L24